jgi:hemerythrin-like domain-containing protein
MNRPIPMASLISTPGVGFDQPFEMLEACHERVARMLALLQRLRGHLPAHGADANAQQAARDVMRYFDMAAPHHHRDEELHVFPPLLARGDREMLALVARLQQDHVQMEARWQQARQVLAAVASGALQALSASDEAALEAFAVLYDGHIEAEERLAYPAAAALLDAPALAGMGQEMARRRGAA